MLKRMTKYVSISRVVEITGLTERQVRRFAEIGSLPCYVTDGGHRRFIEDEVIGFGLMYNEYEEYKQKLFNPKERSEG